MVKVMLDTPFSSEWKELAQKRGLFIEKATSIAVVSITGFNTLFPVAIGMGSTRVQFLKAYYGTVLGAVFFAMLLLNVCHYCNIFT